MHSLNRLSSETSPYLLQHATNPVNWFAWGDEAFETAKRENKLMLISVGYSSCHWCHVMEREVFSNQQVAEFMNDHYVCVKVDREERPDVDQIYMNAVQIITRSGGWPLNCFTTPEGKPVFGGTYFPKESWMDILKGLNETWQNEPERVIEVAEELTQGVRQTQIVSKQNEEGKISVRNLKEYVENWTRYFDSRFGAHKGAPKFPMPGSLSFLLQYAKFFADEKIFDHLKLTLGKIVQGGIYDHIGGGFFRYSVDERWDVPHFEKMLYDNVQLIGLYSSAYEHYKNDYYKNAVYQTIEFLRRELRSPEGGFYSAIDADSEGEEGKFYTWSKGEIENILGGNAEIFSVAYGISAAGNHLGKNVIQVAASARETACVFALSEQDVVKSLDDSRAKLFNARAVRPRPVTDDKIILSWNALAVTSLVKAYQVFNEPSFLNDAVSCIQFIENKLFTTDGTLNRIHCKGKTSVPGFLDDYAFLIQSYIALYQTTFNEIYIEKAHSLTQKTIDNFYCSSTGMFYYSKSEHDNLITRKMEITDGVIPSSTAVMAENLLVLSVYFRDSKLHEMASQMLANMRNELVKGGPYVFKWAEVYMKLFAEPIEVLTSGQNAAAIQQEIASGSNFPFLVPAVYSNETKLPIAEYPVNDGEIKLCFRQACQKPSKDVSEVISFINEQRVNG
ncbi:MAG TPA: thioredoxin domain-containing protein [Tenuifilaceae bacterium]|nr:thioredoxin domain-containing protein [Tenuifilaceae bacterium]HRX66911.1 thioredoxin domain-containing protein [Tenuifilaceae bacterium]